LDTQPRRLAALDFLVLSHDFGTYDLAIGVWGTAAFSDDLAADTRDALTDLIAEGLRTEEAT
jgi:hypothetical protein